MEIGGLTIEHRWDREWKDEGTLFNLPPGVQVKIYREDAEAGEVDMLIKLPPGYVEPRHTHDSVHSVVVLEGVLIVDGVEQRPGDYNFGPRNKPHGPFHYPEGAVLFCSMRGKSLQHIYDSTAGHP
jgi:quercetin dioxygenase-like cupin family protein